MPINAAQAKQLRTLITKRVSAEVDASWKGAQPPDEGVTLEANLKDAQKRLDEYITSLTGKGI